MTAYCFLTINDPVHPGVWEQWLGDALVFVHAKNPQNLSPLFRGNQIPERVETEWGTLSLVDATLRLFDNAFKDPRVSRVVLISGNCLPVLSRPLVEQMLSYLGDASGASPFANKDTSWRKLPKDIPHDKASQFLTLSRKAWECNVFDKHRDSFKGSFAPDEHFFAMTVPLSGATWRPVKITWFEFRAGQRHPRTLLSVDEHQGRGFLFMRKVTAESRLSQRYLDKVLPTK